jgi:hypothetical protein
MKSVNAFAIGSVVLIGIDSEATITAVMVKDGDYVQYEGTVPPKPHTLILTDANRSPQ